jgi:hypothetical protein
MYKQHHTNHAAETAGTAAETMRMQMRHVGADYYIASKLVFSGSASSVCNSINYICYEFNILQNLIENANIILIIQL